MRAFLSLQALEYAEATLQLCEQILKRLQTLASSEMGQPNTSPRVVEQREIPVVTLPRGSSSSSNNNNNNDYVTDVGSFPGIETGSSHATTPTLGAQERSLTGASLPSPAPSDEASRASGQRALEVVVQASRAMLLFHRGLLDSIRGAYEDGTDAFDAAVILCESLDQGAWDLSVSAALQGTLDGTNRLFTALSVQDWVRAAHNNSALCSVQTEDLADALEKLDRAKRTNASLSPEPASAAEAGTAPLAAQSYLLSDWEGCCIQKHYAWVAERVPWELQHVIANADLELSPFVQQFEDTSLAR
ncbi:hypothetical protein F1559_000227 [Cyanidiococcus yangmingshanensis]|uniref:Uncharacterized protein n=1 Tax=Cyanidiococcus yangmingshanensis TaxID=2690220 RepID=A0A7J7IK35_9RHOD|nr:hypothetical protein F1559_000227 [Cyanidiococcus yangmingshanensis]